MSAVAESQFEQDIADWLVQHGGYQDVKFGNQAVAQRDIDPVLGVDWTELETFIGATQQHSWDALIERHGGDQQTTQKKFKDRLAKELDARGTVDVLRHGVVDMGVTIRLAYFLPASGLNPELMERYNANRLTVVRQFAYEADSSKTIDLALLVNGLLVATAELKNPLTGQTIEDAVAQYRTDRDPKNVALARRAVVHFALDTELVQLTTRLDDAQTRFLPFDRGDGMGKGNPPNPHGHRTAYLWEQVWQRDVWLDLLNRFVHVEKPEKGSKTPARVIFPRYHQWDAVRCLEAHAREHGAGQRYLVQHSAGSGKSNTIAWLAHRLSSLHDSADEAVFDKVIVITDRVVLDQQLQDTIYQFEHVHGVVVKIDEDSAQLAAALTGAQARIIITTLQKFPFVLDKIEGLPARKYAVIVDEAHSSQTGDAARDLKLALGGTTPDQELTVAEVEDAGYIAAAEDPVEEALAKAVGARGMPKNLSFFAFTATPKGKTLELFGTKPPGAEKPEPFHLYPMKQAIEEGFILDVLASYTTYEMYWNIEKAIADDPKYETPKARRAIAKFVSLHDYNLAQKADVIIEHFREHVAGRIDGQAKAMVVTSSRLHAVRYTLALRSYIAEHGYPGIGVLGAFSGTVTDGAAEWTESKINGFPESQTAKQLNGPDFQILVVAEKYQTGFDQPKLYAMYVDRALTGLAAVQTLSRLNRTMEGKTGTFVLDFRNDADDIRDAFKPYYGKTVALPTDPNLLYDTRHALDEFGVLRTDEVKQMTGLLLLPPTENAHGRIHAAMSPAIDRFWKDLDEDAQGRFREGVDRFVRTYAFLSQLVNFGDVELERDYLFCKALARFIRAGVSAPPSIADAVELTHLRHELTFAGSITLPANDGEVKTIFDGAGKKVELEEERLSKIIAQLNERYGTSWTDADRLHFDSVAEDLIADPSLQQQAAANTRENFKIPFEKRFNEALIQRLASNEDLTYKVLDSEAMRDDLIAAYLPLIYGRAKVAHQEHCPIGDLISRPEDSHLEKKSTFRWDMKKAEVSKVMETETLKTVAAFLNSREGGTLLIGVADDNEPLGLGSDYLSLHKEGKDDADLFQLALHQAILNAVGAAAATNVTSQVHAVDGKGVCRVHVRPSGHPVHATVTTVDSKGQHEKKARFYVRVGNGTREITDEAEIQKYVAGRWGKGGGQ